MLKSGSLIRTGPLLVLVLVAGMLSGCSSKQERALDQAKKQAATTGQAQQVVSVDKNGTTTTTVVQPPTAGQANAAITTTVTVKIVVYGDIRFTDPKNTDHSDPTARAALVKATENRAAAIAV